MIEITILSGKGGTGKTTISAALASIAENAVYCDNDVDASDLHLIFKPEVNEINSFASGWDVHIDNDKCSECQLCLQHCRFDAIHKNNQGALYINNFQCEGCRLCERICPNDAITSIKNNNNQWFISSSRFGDLVHAEMGAGEENSGKLVTQIRKKAKEIAQANNNDYVINDGPPGIGCATIASLSGTDKVLLVIEPTMSGFHDVIRLIELVDSFENKIYAIINKYDINEEITSEIEHYLNKKGIPLMACIPFDEMMVESMNAGQTIVEYKPESNVSQIITNIWEQLK